MSKILLFVFFSFSFFYTDARQLHTIRSGSWEADSVWYNQMVPDSVNDTILVLHHVELNTNIILSINDYLHIAQGAWLCGNVDLYMNSNAHLFNEGFLGLYYWQGNGGTSLNDSTGYIDLGQAGASFTDSGYFDNDKGCMLVHYGPQTCICGIDTNVEINTSGYVAEFITPGYYDYKFIYYFGDGSNTETYDTSTVHTYADTGTYQLTLIVYSCCTIDTIYRTVHTEPPPCLCQNDTSLAISSSGFIAFFETDSQAGDAYHYIFGDGSDIYTSSASLSHTYRDTGFLQVTLIITDCCHTDTLHRLIYIPPPCVNDFPLTLHPNPADGGFNVGWQFCSDAEVFVKLYTLTGQIVNSYRYSTSSQILQGFIPTDKLPSGCYIAYFESTGLVTRKKVVVVHSY